MELTIGEVSEKTGLSISKLRYYDEHGLIPNLKDLLLDLENLV